MTMRSDERMAQLLQQLGQQPGLPETLPGAEGAMVRDAMNGASVYEIAQQHGTSEEAVWRALSTAARLASGQPMTQVETGGFGSDTDPGVTGGYGETGFGSLSADIDPGVVDADDAAAQQSTNDLPPAQGGASTNR